jgi:inner membrane protein
MEWWIWMVLGLALLLAELVTPGGFYFIFFGAGAVVVGMLAGLGAGGPVWFQILLFSILSLLSLWLFREKLLKLTEQAPDMKIDTLIGETAVASDEIPVNGIGKVELRGTAWSARNTGGRALKNGERAKVERVEGLMLFVQPENN